MKKDIPVYFPSCEFLQRWPQQDWLTRTTWTTFFAEYFGLPFPASLALENSWETPLEFSQLFPLSIALPSARNPLPC